MIKTILLIIVTILSVLGFISVILRLFSANPGNNKINLELLILFSWVGTNVMAADVFHGFNSYFRCTWSLVRNQK